MKTPANEHQAHLRMDYRFDDRNSLALRYNMVRWQKDNEAGGLSLPGTGFIWDNNVDTVHGMFTTVKSSRFLNEVRAQYSRYTDSRAAKVRRRQHHAHQLLDQRRQRPGHVGRHSRRSPTTCRTRCRCGWASTR